MNCQMIRVISSPSISTTGLATLIFAIGQALVRERNKPEAGRAAMRQTGAGPRVPIAPAVSRRKAEFYRIPQALTKAPVPLYGPRGSDDAGRRDRQDQAMGGA